MKKPGFVITETIFSIVLAASVAAVTVLAIDLKTDKFHIDRFNPFSQSDSASDTDIKEDSKNSETSVSEKSKAETYAAESSEEASKTEASKAEKSTLEESKAEVSDAEKSVSEESAAEEDAGKIKLLSEPADLKAQPKELEEMLRKNEYTLETSVYGTNLIVIDTTASEGDITKAVIYCYQKSDSSEYWWNIIGEGKPICDEAYIAENGSNYYPGNDSKITPGGVFTAGQGFYIKEKPDTGYPMFEITNDTYWVTDPESKFYNQRVEGIDEKDWSIADHMITSEKSYKYGLVINYNTSSPDGEKASGIFMQCGTAPTEGSIALPENIMKTILEWLDEDSIVNVYITV